MPTPLRPEATERDVMYPSLFSQMDAASVWAQRRHSALLKWNLFLLTASSVFSTIPYAVFPWRWVTPLLTALCLLTSLLLLGMSLWLRPDALWFDSRAVAESVKTLAWKYMMHVSPYESEVADTVFAHDIVELAQAKPNVTALATKFASGSSIIISAAMTKVRKSAFQSRKADYLTVRLEDQVRWYSEKAKSLTRMSGAWVWGIVAVQLGAITISVVSLISPFLTSSVSLLMTFVTAMIAWVQAKDYRELAKAYAITAQELSGFRVRAESAGDGEFEALVDLIEGSISREHKMWQARRTSE